MRIDNNFLSIASTYVNRVPRVEKPTEVNEVKKEKVVEPVSKAASSRKSGDSFERSVNQFYGLYNRKGQLY